MESTLALELSSIAADVGGYLGFGRAAANWSGWQAANPYVPSSNDSQLGWIMACIQEGLRQFYWPKAIDGSPLSHKWSFLTPNRQLTVAPSVGVYDMPDDFRSMVGEFTYQPTDSTLCTIRRVGIGEVKRYLQQLMGTTNKPLYCAIYPKASDNVMGQRFAISFAPVPDAAYTLDYRCDVLPNALTAQNPYPLGGAAHASTILASCRAIAESYFNDEQTTMMAFFQQRLQASITADIRDFKPDNLGYNADRSEIREGLYGAFGTWGPWSPWMTQTAGATMNGNAM